MYMMNVIRNMEGIRAFEEWEKTKPPFRKKFIRSLARVIHPREYFKIETAELSTNRKSKEFTKLLTPIRKKHAKLMTRRKQILFLYETVGFLHSRFLI
jgi:hypothetical protein